MRKTQSFLCSCLILFLLAFPCCVSAEGPLLIDAIVASVDGKPITLVDLCKRLKPPRKLDLSQASSDREAQTVLNEMILEKLIYAEAESKKMQVTDSDIDNYLNEIAARNNMNRQQFESALQKENISLEKYKEDIKFDILKSRLASSYVKSNVSITDDEVEKYLDEKIGKSGEGSQIQLRQIFISASGRGRAEAKQIAEEAQKAGNSGSDFADIARKYSDGPEKEEGGSLGVIAEKDLSPDIFEIIFPLKEGEISSVVETANGYRIIKVEKRFNGESKHDERLINETRSMLEKSRMEEKLMSYFMTDIYKLHSVDKKI